MTPKQTEAYRWAQRWAYRGPAWFTRTEMAIGLKITPAAADKRIRELVKLRVLESRDRAVRTAAGRLARGYRISSAGSKRF